MNAVPTCYVCGSAELAEGVDLRSPTCERCLPARDHVISMQRAANRDLVAKCSCGRQFRTKPHFGAQRDAWCRQHWQDAIAQAAAAAAQ